LLVIGTGTAQRYLKRLAGPTVHFAGWQSEEVLRDHLRRCRALLFPGEEDFGIVPVEANACGTPVIAFGRGGATETIVPPDCGGDPTGVWFSDQTSEAVIDAIQRFELRQGDFRPLSCQGQATRFDRRRFEREMLAYLGQILRREDPPMQRAA
jgi:glycosyltransferase involved in cell wall biosynthesis